MPDSQLNIIISEMNRILKIKEMLLDLIFPAVCLHCGTELMETEKTSRICHKCLGEIRINSTLFCARCRARLPDNRKICHRDTQYMLAAAVNYDGPIKDIVHQLKYRRWTSLADVIRPILNEYIGKIDLSLENSVIIPIPLHPERLKERGFNQSEIIGSIISEISGIPMRDDLLIRSRKTKAQAELKNFQERSENMTGAFSAINSDALKNKNVILVDDVYTSGSTMDDAARALRESGAKKILAFAFTKAR